MLNGYYNAVAGLRVLSQGLDLTAHNLANANTVGFKASRGFAEALEQAVNTTPGTAPHLASPVVDLSQGPLRHTGQALDVALPPGTLLAVQTPSGERYTRDGRLTVDPATNALVTLAGHPVVGDSGPIEVDGVPEIREDGGVYANGVETGSLKVVSVTHPALLKPEGAGLYRSDASLPVAGDLSLKPGMVEASNIDPVRGTIELLEAVRRFQALANANQILMGQGLRALFEESGRTLGH